MTLRFDRRAFTASPGQVTGAQAATGISETGECFRLYDACVILPSHSRVGFGLSRNDRYRLYNNG